MSWILPVRSSSSKITSCAILSILRSTLNSDTFSTGDSALRCSFLALGYLLDYLVPLSALSAPVSWCWKTHSQRCLVAAAVAVAAIAKHSPVQSSVRDEASRVFQTKFVPLFFFLRNHFADAICRHRVVFNYSIRPCLPES